MIRNPKTFCLALVAMLAMSALAASAAYAEQEGHFTTSEPSTANHVAAFVTANDEHENLVIEKPDGSTITCVEDVFHGTVNGTAKSLLIEPTFGGSGQGPGDGPCQFAGLPLTMEENGCELELYTLETDAGAADWQALTRIAGCEGPGIEMQVFAGEAHGFEVCNIVWPEQEGLEGVTATTEVTAEGIHDLTIGVSIQNQIAYEQTGLCGAEEGNLSLTGGLTMTAEGKLGEVADLTINHTEE